MQEASDPLHVLLPYLPNYTNTKWRKTSEPSWTDKHDAKLSERKCVKNILNLIPEMEKCVDKGQALCFTVTVFNSTLNVRMATRVANE